MENIIIEIVLGSLFIIGLGTYIIGKKKHIELLRVIGTRSSWLMIVMILAYAFLKYKNEYI